MPTIKTHPITGFAQIPNETLQDTTISSKARGILTYILSFPSDWTVTIQLLSKQLSEGHKAISSAFKELIAAGYVTKQQEWRANGEYGELVYHFYAEKQQIQPIVHENEAEVPFIETERIKPPTTEKPAQDLGIKRNGLTLEGLTLEVNPYKEDIYKEDIYKETVKRESLPDFDLFKNLWNSEKNSLWATCKTLDQVRVNLIKRLIKDTGSCSAALETLEKACKYGRTDKYWNSKRLAFETVLRKAVSWSEQYLETPNGHVISDSDISMAARMKETQELADRLAKKFNYNGVNNNA
jgi:hypothetical protein